MSRAIDRVLAAARAADPAVERREVDAAATTALGDLQTALSPSLFGEAAVVVVRSAGEASEAVLAALLAGLADLPDDTWVVVEHSAGRSKAAVAGLAALRTVTVAGGVAEAPCVEVRKGRETRQLLESLARSAGRRLTSDAAEALVLALGSDVAVLVGALEQLLSDVDEDPIDAAVVTGLFLGVAEVSGFQLADAVWSGEGLLALQRLRWGTASQDISPAGAVGSLAAGLRSMVRVGCAPRGLSEADVARVAGAPPFKVRQLRDAYRAWPPAELADAVVRLADVDAAVKGGLRPGESLEPAQKIHELEAFVLVTAGLRERRGRPREGPVPSA